MAGHRDHPRSSEKHASRQQHRLPQQVLGRSYSTWTVVLLQAFLDYYGRPQKDGITKNHLFQQMDVLAQDYNLDGSDYDEMFAAYWARQELPARKQPLAATSHHSEDTSTAPDDQSQPVETPISTQLRPMNAADHIQQAGEEDLSEKKSGSTPTARDPSTGSKETCIACWEELTPENAPRGTITSECAHGADFCRPCIALSISSQLQAKHWDRITCPVCEANMSDPNNREFAAPEILAR